MILSLCQNITYAASPYLDPDPDLDPSQPHISLQKQRRESMFKIPLEVLHEYVKRNENAPPLNLTIPNKEWAYGTVRNEVNKEIIFDPSLKATADKIAAIMREFSSLSTNLPIHSQIDRIEALKEEALLMCANGSFDLAYFLMHYGSKFRIYIQNNTFDAYPQLIKPRTTPPPYAAPIREKSQEIREIMTRSTLSFAEKRYIVFEEEINTLINVYQILTEDERISLQKTGAPHKEYVSLLDWMQVLAHFSHNNWTRVPTESLKEILNHLNAKIQNIKPKRDSQYSRLATHHVLFGMLMYGEYTPFFTHPNQDFYTLLFLMEYYEKGSSMECLNHYMPKIAGSLILQYERHIYPSQNDQIQQNIQNWGVIQSLGRDKDWLENVGSAEGGAHAIYKISRKMYEENMDCMFDFLISFSESARTWYKNYIHLIPQKRFEGYPFDDLPWLQGLSRDLQLDFLLIMHDIVKHAPVGGKYGLHV